jgi:hypothetical protein
MRWMFCQIAPSLERIFTPRRAGGVGLGVVEAVLRVGDAELHLAGCCTHPQSPSKGIVFFATSEGADGAGVDEPEQAVSPTASTAQRATNRRTRTSENLVPIR